MRWKGALTIVDCHCEGEVGRVITGGMPQVMTRPMFDKKPYLEEHPITPQHGAL
jgi:proline racemase